MPFEQLLPANLFAAFLIFARIGSAMMLLPGFGELYVPQRYRLLLALMMAGLLTPVLSPLIPPLPGSAATLGVLVFGEVVIGVFIGTLARRQA
jgi:flagellar biosynthesis protein FliR